MDVFYFSAILMRAQCRVHASSLITERLNILHRSLNKTEFIMCSWIHQMVLSLLDYFIGSYTSSDIIKTGCNLINICRIKSI